MGRHNLRQNIVPKELKFEFRVINIWHLNPRVINDKLLLNEVSTTINNNITNEEDYNFHDEANDNPRWGKNLLLHFY